MSQYLLRDEIETGVRENLFHAAPAGELFDPVLKSEPGRPDRSEYSATFTVDARLPAATNTLIEIALPEAAALNGKASALPAWLESTCG